MGLRGWASPHFPLLVDRIYCEKVDLETPQVVVPEGRGQITEVVISSKFN
jgi:hypothetical protein